MFTFRKSWNIPLYVSYFFNMILSFFRIRKNFRIYLFDNIKQVLSIHELLNTVSKIDFSKIKKVIDTIMKNLVLKINCINYPKIAAKPISNIDCMSPGSHGMFVFLDRTNLVFYSSTNFLTKNFIEMLLYLRNRIRNKIPNTFRFWFIFCADLYKMIHILFYTV